MLVEGLVLEVDAVRLPSDWGRVGRTAVMGAGADRMSLPGSRSSVKARPLRDARFETRGERMRKSAPWGWRLRSLWGAGVTSGFRFPARD